MLSFLDNDLYTFTVGQAINRSPYLANSIAEYRLINRSNIKLNQFYSLLDKKVKQIREIRLSGDEKEYLSSLNLFDKSYLDWLSDYQYDIYQLSLWDNGTISIRGKWSTTIYWEVPLLATLSELISNEHDSQVDLVEQINLAENKARQIALPFAEFGTRRRFSSDVHRVVLSALARYPHFLGTSNVHFAREMNLKPLGTVSHQWYSAFEALLGVAQANIRAAQAWQETYPNSIGLTDTFTSELWWMQMATDINSPLRKFRGFRQDSGDPIRYLRDCTNWLNIMGEKPSDYSIIFSDSLDKDKVYKIARAANNMESHPQLSCAIGTNLTNDIAGYKAPQLTFKLWELDGRPCTKLSDDDAKACGREYDAVNWQVHNLCTHLHRQIISEIYN